MGGQRLSDAKQATCQGRNAKLGTPHGGGLHCCWSASSLARCSNLAVVLLLVMTGWQAWASAPTRQP